MTNFTPMSFWSDYVFLEFLLIFFIAKDVSSLVVPLWVFVCVFLLHFILAFPKPPQTTKIK